MICRYVGEKQMKCFTLLNKKDYSLFFLPLQSDYGVTVFASADG